MRGGSVISLAQIRRAQQLTQGDLALLAGVSQPLIALVERGHRRLGETNRERVCRALGLTPQDAARVRELRPDG